MQQELGNGLSQAGTHDPAENSLFETMARVEHDLNDLIDALALLGVKRCSQCRTIFPLRRPRRALRLRPTRLLRMHSRLVVFLSMRLGVTDRERIEGKLASWLRKYHRAEVVKETPGTVPDTTNAEFQIVAKCARVRWLGKAHGGRALPVLQRTWDGADRGAKVNLGHTTHRTLGPLGLVEAVWAAQCCWIEGNRRSALM